MPHTLFVKKLDPRATLPTCAHPGSDLGIDLYALDEVELRHDDEYVARIPTGVAVEMQGHGFIIKDRSSLAAAGVFTHGGVIDEGYRGEIVVLMSNSSDCPFFIKAGQKIAQMIPVRTQTNLIEEAEHLSGTVRSDKGFGSTGE